MIEWYSPPLSNKVEGGREKEKEQRIYKSNGRRIADTLTAFETIKYNPSGLTPWADPNRKALDGLTASEIKKAAGLPCRGRVFLQ